MAYLYQLIKEKSMRNKICEDLPLLGVNKDKEFMPSVANTIGTDLSSYKIIRKGQFAVNLMHVARDEIVPVSLLTDYEKAIVSPAYNVFKIIDESILNNEYLMLCFKRNLFDKNAWFLSGSSVRGNLEWRKFLEIDIPLPNIEEQLRIVHDYNVIEERISIKEAINNNLSDEIDLIFRKRILRSSISKSLLIDFLNFERGIEPGSSSYEYEKSKDNIEFFRVQDIMNTESKIYANRLLVKNKIANITDILVSFDGSVGKIGFGINGAYSSGIQKISSKIQGISSAIIYAIFHSNDIQMELGKSSGTTIAHAGKFINNLTIPFDLNLYKDVQVILEPIFTSMLLNKIEINNLKKIQTLLLRNISLKQQ